MKISSVSLGTKIVLLLGANVALMAGASLSPVMPAMMAEFASVSGTAFWVSMIITLPALFVVIGGPIAGYLTDRFGRKTVLVAAIFFGGLSGNAGVILNDIGLILASRALLGLCIAGAMTATNALIADYFEGQQRAKFMGLQTAFSGLGAVIFLPIGGYLADINWHYAFLTHLPLLVLFPLAWIFIREPVMLSFEGSSVEKTQLKFTPTNLYIFTAGFLSQITFMTIPIFIAYFLTIILGASGLQVGLAGATSGLMTFIGGWLYERISRGVRLRRLTIASFLILGAGFLIMGLSTTWVFVILGLLILGFCLGLTISNLTTWLASQVSPQVRGRANGIFVTLMFLGQFMASIIFTPVANLTSYAFVYILCAVIVVLTGFAGLFVKSETEQRGAV